MTPSRLGSDPWRDDQGPGAQPRAQGARIGRKSLRVAEKRRYGFRDQRGGFSIDQHTLNETWWREGFGGANATQSEYADKTIKKIRTAQRRALRKLQDDDDDS